MGTNLEISRRWAFRRMKPWHGDSFVDVALLSYFLVFSSSPLKKAVFPRERMLPAGGAASRHIPGHSSFARASSKSVCLCRPSVLPVRGRSLVVGERQVSIGGVGRRPGRAIRMLLVAQKSCKSLSLHHCLQESRHITRADRFSTFPLFSRYHHTTLHRHTDHLAHNWDVDQASGPSLALLADIRK